MRMSSTLGLTAAFVIASTLGCGQKSTSSPVIASSVSAGAPGQAPSDPISQVVFEFLDAVRQGNTAVASQRLTPLALKRTSELDLNFSPPGSPTAKFQVGDSETIEADKAVVSSVWTDLDADGKPSDESIVWALKLTDGQWRISGMATQIGEQEQPVIIDFENPESMVESGPPQTPPAAQPLTNPAPARPANEVARDPFQQPAQR